MVICELMLKKPKEVGFKTQRNGMLSIRLINFEFWLREVMTQFTLLLNLNFKFFWIDI